MHRNTLSERTKHIEVLRILVAFDDGYALPTKVMLKSLILNNPTYQIEVYVLYYSLTEQNIISLRELESERATLVFRKIEDEVLENLPAIAHWSKETFIRLFAHEYLDENVDRILWLDGDIIINGDISELYKQNFKGNCFIGVRDMDAFEDPIRHDRIELPREKLYINAGVLLMNLSEIRKRTNYKEAIQEYVERKHNELSWLDQDILNGVFYNDIKVVDSHYRFNFFSREINACNEKRILKEKKIIHYISKYKPWKIDYPYGGFKLWWQYRTMINDSISAFDYRMIKKTHIKQRAIHEVGHAVGLPLKRFFPSIYKKCLSLYLKQK